MEKYPDGSSVFRSLRAEERAAAEFLKTKQRKMEIIYSQIQKKFEEKNSKGTTSMSCYGLVYGSRDNLGLELLAAFLWRKFTRHRRCPKRSFLVSLLS